MNAKRELVFYLVLMGLVLVGTVPLLTRQHNVPILKSDVWPKFKASKASCGIDQHDWKMRCEIAYTPQVQALNGNPVTLDGFIMPLEATEKFTHFMLSARAPSCPDCPPGGPNEMVEVFAKTPMKWSEQTVAMHGTLKLLEPKNETGVFFQLFDADNAVFYKTTGTSQAPTPQMKAVRQHSFTELNGVNAQTTTLQSWADKPLLVSFWRSDCPPCLNELKTLSHIATQHPSLPIALILLQDAQHTRRYLPPMPANVHILVAQTDGKELLTAFGNDKMMALPYSVMLDAGNSVCQKHNGIITPDVVTLWLKQCSLSH